MMSRAPDAIRIEDDLHRAVVKLLLGAAKGDFVFYHVPNGMGRARLKWLGVRRGASDLAFVLPGGRAAFLELKRPKGGRISDDQERFERDVTQLGALHAYARTVEEALAALREWGVLPNATAGGVSRGGGEGEAITAPPSPRHPSPPGALGVPA